MSSAFFAVLLAIATPAPPPSSIAPCQCLSGISVGDNASAVLARLHSQPIPGSDQQIMSDFNSYVNGLILAVYYYRGAVVAVSITSPGNYAQIQTADPYGIKLGDTAAALTAARGSSTSTTGNIMRYGPTDGIHWDYTVEAGTITTILVSSVPSLP